MTKLLGPKDLKARGVSFSPKTLEKLEAEGTFPRRIKLSERKPAWLETEVDAFVDRAVAARGAVPPGAGGHDVAGGGYDVGGVAYSGHGATAPAK